MSGRISPDNYPVVRGRDCPVYMNVQITPSFAYTCRIGGEDKRLVKTPRPCGAAFIRELRLHSPTTGLEPNGFELIGQSA